MLPDQAGRTRRVEGVHSTAAVGGHPIHPMIIPFPVAFLTGALATDVAYVRTHDPFWARASQWMLRAGLASGVAAAVFGAADWMTIRQARSNAAGIFHAGGNAAALALAYGNLRRRHGNRERAIEDGGLVLSASLAALLGATAMAGGELVYKHGIGVAGHGRDAGREGTEPRGRASPMPGFRDEGHVRWGRAPGAPATPAPTRYGRAEGVPADAGHPHAGRAPGVPAEGGHERYGRARLRGASYQTRLERQ